MTTRASFGLFVSAIGALAAAGCDCSGPTRLRCRTDSDCRDGQLCIDQFCVVPVDSGFPDGAVLDGGMDAPMGACRIDDECATGDRCVGGTCCSPTQACGDVCCGTSATCFAGACVVPGDECRTSADCGDREYCEPALGGGAPDGGIAGDAGRTCTSSSPRPGRCVALPPTCPSGDGGVDGGTGCVSECEYRPEVGMLSAEVAWDWGHSAPPPTNPNFVDVWTTPAVGRLYDANCDGVVDELDPPNVVFVSGRAISETTGIGTCCQCTGGTPTSCHTGILRVLDGRTGETVMSVRAASASSVGFSGTSVALGDVDSDGSMDVVAVTGEGYVVLIDGDGTVLRTSDAPIPGAGGDGTFGWGGGLAIADMEGDGFPEIAYGATLFTTTGGTITRAWTGTSGTGGGAIYQQLSTFADVDEDGDLELVAGKTAYRADGTMLWDRPGLNDGFPAVADLDEDGLPEVIIVAAGQVTVLAGATGATVRGPFTLPGAGAGGPPTVADFDGDGSPEIGVAQQNRYTVIEADPGDSTALRQVWSTQNHDLSSSVTGSTVFDFEGDGIAEVVYADECYLWVYDGPTGAVRFAAFTSSFTGTEASVVADVDGDGHAEIVLPSNGADPGPAGWGCMTAGGPSVVNGVTWVPGPAASSAYRGLRVFRDPARTWVGTRPIWNQHTYHVTNVCVPPDGACDVTATYGSIPRVERRNWDLDWLDNFRQNVQETGLFDAPDATLVLEVRCTEPPTLVASVRNLGAAILPPGVQVDFFLVETDGTETPLGTARTTGSVFPGALEQVSLVLSAGADPMATYRARIVNPAAMPTFRECRDDNDDSADVTGSCVM